MIKAALIPAFLAVVVFGAWGPMMTGGLVSDDWVWLERARTGVVLQPGLFFRPACWLTWRLHPEAGYGWIHMADLAVHWLCAWQLARTITILGGNVIAGAAVAAVFTVLPTLHEAVCWSSARCGPLAAACVLAGIGFVLQGRGAWVAAPLFACALASQEPALALMWGVPLLLLGLHRNRDAAQWVLVLSLLTVLYMVFLKNTGSHVGLSGGYAAPFRLRRTLLHLGAYLGAWVGAEGTGRLWILWPVGGIAALWTTMRMKRRMPLVIWAWTVIVMAPYIRLGGPEQQRFVYLMLLPVMVGAGIALGAWSKENRRRQILAMAAAAASVLCLTPATLAVCSEWRDAAARVAVIVDQAAHALPEDRPVIAVNPPEWNGRAHLFRNGLFPALRLTTGRGFSGVSIPPSLGVETCGQLVTWLTENAPLYAKNPRVGAWLFLGDTICVLKGWREPANTDLPLEALCRGGVDPQEGVSPVAHVTPDPRMYRRGERGPASGSNSREPFTDIYRWPAPCGCASEPHRHAAPRSGGLTG